MLNRVYSREKIITIKAPDHDQINASNRPICIEGKRTMCHHMSLFIFPTFCPYCVTPPPPASAIVDPVLFPYVNHIELPIIYNFTAIVTNNNSPNYFKWQKCTD